MEIGMIGLGRMGANMAKRIMTKGHQCIGYDLSQESVKKLEESGAKGANSLADLIAQLPAPRVVWCMVPAGDITDKTVAALADLMSEGDIIIDGGNSNYKDDVARAKSLETPGIKYIDVGTSGGVWGFERGYCMMVGGEDQAVKYIDPILTALAPGRGDIERTPGRGEQTGGTAEEGYLHCGPAGAGHFVKMIHNGIEYGLMQAYGEGFDILRSADSENVPEEHRYEFDLKEIAEVWRRGSVIGSWLLDLTAIALLQDPDLSRYSGFVNDSGEGRWTVQAAVERAVPADVLTASLYTRFRSRQDHTFSEKILSAMREQFGGHVEK